MEKKKAPTESVAQNENTKNRIKGLLNENGMEYAEDSLELIYSPKGLYTITEFSGLEGPHVICMSFELPYLDWCRFEKSSVYSQLVDYLRELQNQKIRCSAARTTSC